MQNSTEITHLFKDVTLKTEDKQNLPAHHVKWEFCKRLQIENLDVIELAAYNTHKLIPFGFYKPISKPFPFANEL